MKVLVLGGTGFIGPHVVRQLAGRGHEVTIIHRGATEVSLPDSVRHIHAPFCDLPDVAAGISSGDVDVVLDMVPYLDKTGHGVLHFRDIANRAAVVTSGDVYRAFGRLWRTEPGPPDPVPLTEDSPLRSGPVADSGPEEVTYDNLEVEQAVAVDRRLPVTILRLPATYGPADPQHRLFRYLKRMDDRRPFIVLEEPHARWRRGRGYVENVAEAIVIAIEARDASGRVYNVAERVAYTEEAWVRRIGKAVGWVGQVIAIPAAVLPESKRQPYDFSQQYIIDSTRIRSELGYIEPVDADEALRKTIDWERSNPPDPMPVVDYDSEDGDFREYWRTAPGV